MAWRGKDYITRPFQELADKYELVAVCDRHQEVAEDWGRRLGLDPARDVFTDYRQMLERPDLQVVDILVPIPQNHAVAEEVARAGKHIILEKPLGATYEQAVATTELPYLYQIKNDDCGKLPV